MKRICYALACWWLVSAAQAVEPVELLATQYPPYEYTDQQGQPAGFDLEVVLAAFEAAGLPARVRFAPWKRVVAEVREGRAAGMFSCSDSPQRRDFVLLSDPISEESKAIALHAGRPEPLPRRIPQLKGLRLGAFAGYGSNYLLDEAGLEYIEIVDPPLGLRMLVRGRVDALAIGLESGQFVARTLGLRNQVRFIPLGNPPPVPYHVCFGSKWPQAGKLRDAFNRGLREIRDNGRYQAIRDRYR